MTIFLVILLLVLHFSLVSVFLEFMAVGGENTQFAETALYI